MMNELIKEQLNNVQIAKLPEFDDDTLKIFIPKYDEAQENDVLLGYCYLIELEDYVIHEPSNFTLSANWNNGSKPTDNKMSVEVKKIMGKMTYVNGVGINDNKVWEGWLPKASIKVIERL